MLGVAFAAMVIVCAFAFVMVYFPNFQQRAASSGFEPGWDCTPQPKGGPVCIKKVGK